MKVLNLVYPHKSDIQFKVSKFPDGQQQIDIVDEGYEEGNIINDSMGG